MDKPPYQATHRDSPSSRFQRDYRVRGGQHSSESRNASSSGSTDPSASMQLPRKHDLQPGGTRDTDWRSKRSTVNAPQVACGRAASQKHRTEWQAPDQETENNSGSRTAQTKAAGEAGTAVTARKRAQKTSGKYRTEGRQMYSHSGVWRTWGPARAAHESSEAGNDTAVKPDLGGAGKTGIEGVSSRPPVESPISWGLYARSYASVKGKLSPALRSQPGKTPGKDPDSAKSARDKPDSAGEGVPPNCRHSIKTDVSIARCMHSLAWLSNSGVSDA